MDQPSEPDLTQVLYWAVGSGQDSVLLDISVPMVGVGLSASPSAILIKTL